MYTLIRSMHLIMFILLSVLNHSLSVSMWLVLIPLQLSNLFCLILGFSDPVAACVEFGGNSFWKRFCTVVGGRVNALLPQTKPKFWLFSSFCVLKIIMKYCICFSLALDLHVFDFLKFKYVWLIDSCFLCCKINKRQLEFWRQDYEWRLPLFEPESITAKTGNKWPMLCHFFSQLYFSLLLCQLKIMHTNRMDLSATTD